MAKGNTQKAHPDDILIAISHYLPQERRCFRYGADELNTFLYEQKQQHPQLMSSLSFNTNGMFPSCEDVYQAVSNLFASGLIVVASHKPYDYHFSPETEGSFDKFVSKRLSEQQLSELEEIAREFNKKIAIDSSLQFN